MIAIEEHFASPGIKEATQSSAWASRLRRLGGGGLRRGVSVVDLLDDLGEGRLVAMDAAGIDVQVLSHTQPAVEDLTPEEAVPLARESNDLLADAIGRHPQRFSGFAVIPTSAPESAADELERAVTRLGFKGAMVNGRTNGGFLDHPSFSPIFERAEGLGVPIYLHPGLPPAAVIEACYEGLPPPVGHLLSSAAWGWHIETGLHVLRLIAAGVFDRYPKLQVIIGHMGEAVPYMVDRTSLMLSKAVTGLQREVKDYFVENFYVTTSGFFSYAQLLCLLLTIGADRVMFAVDYPYSANEEGRRFLDTAPLSPTDREKIAHSNAERLLRL